MTIFSWAEQKVQRLSIWDFGVFKICLISIGMVAGAWLSGFVLANMELFITVFLVTWAWLFFRMLRKP
ncbi:MAG: hypothetical protein OEV30_08560 [Ignavibacteria bacterium]|nr:hypothetical protein [Ignavibacteria bacterium]